MQKSVYNIALYMLVIFMQVIVAFFSSNIEPQTDMDNAFSMLMPIAICGAIPLFVFIEIKMGLAKELFFHDYSFDKSPFLWTKEYLPQKIWFLNIMYGISNFILIIKNIGSYQIKSGVYGFLGFMAGYSILLFFRRINSNLFKSI